MTRRAVFTEADIKRALKAAKAAGVAVARVEISDGKIVLVTDAAPDTVPKSELDQWIDRHENPTQRN